MSQLIQRAPAEGRSTTDAPAQRLTRRYRQVRADTLAFTTSLAAEDMVIQTMADVSPTKWHLAHTTWFFERFILAEYLPDYTFFHPRYEYLFNSYYNSIGPQHCRSNRGVVSRPSVAEVIAFRAEIDRRVLNLLETHREELPADCQARMIIGLNHEQQHQELMVSDLKHVLSTNPLLPAYHPPGSAPGTAPGTGLAMACEACVPGWIEHGGGIVEVGLDHDPDNVAQSFAYDNESPRHRVYLQPFALSDRLVSNAQYRAFIDDGGYQRHDLWLSMGWAWLAEQKITHPFYWYRQADRDGQWMQYTLAGPCPLDDAQPVCHLSYFEADAFARWAGARLPSEFEWETIAAQQPIAGHFAHARRYHPDRIGPQATGRARQIFGDLWEWTRSAYGPYPGFHAAPGALGEYNGKFMCNQYVLRGGSCATPPGHVRPTYRNFFPPDARWQFTGLRLARDL